MHGVLHALEIKTQFFCVEAWELISKEKEYRENTINYSMFYVALSLW